MQTAKYETVVARYKKHANGKYDIVTRSDV